MNEMLNLWESSGVTLGVHTASERAVWGYMPGVWRDQFGDDIVEDPHASLPPAAIATRVRDRGGIPDLGHVDWMRDASCARRPDVKFFFDGLADRGVRAAFIKRTAIALCGQCPVRENCAGYAAELGIDRAGIASIWAGRFYPAARNPPPPLEHVGDRTYERPGPHGERY